MKSLTYVIQDEIGIHARPAGLLVKAAKSFESVCVLHTGDKSADMRHLVALLGLGIGHGAKISITFEGPDEDAAIKAFQKLLEENL